MSSTKEFKDYILEQLKYLGNISYKSMMGEYLLYYNDVLFGGIYDDRLLIKKTRSNEKYNMKESIPYPNVKKMYLIEDVDNQEILANIIVDTYEELK